MNLPGVKQTQRAHEEAHVILWHSSILTELQDVGTTPTKQSIADIFKRFRAENPGTKVSQYKVDIVTQLVLNVPNAAIEVFKAHLNERKFERSALTQDILNSKQLTLEYTPSGCVGAWTKWLCNSEECCRDIAVAIVQHFQAQFASNPAMSEDTAGMKLIKGCRVTDTDVVQFQACAALYHNWLRPTLLAEEPHAADAVHELYLAGGIRQDLYRLSMGKISAQVGSTLTLRGVPAVDATLRRLALELRVPRSDEQLRRVAEGKRAEWVTLSNQARVVQQAFVDFVQDSCSKLLQDAVSRAEATAYNAKAGPEAANQFLQKYSRSVALASAAEATNSMERMREDMVTWWSHKAPHMSRKDQVPTFIIMHVDDVPLRDSGSAERRTAAAAEMEAEAKTGDPRTERGNRSQWMDLLSAAAAQVTTYPEHTILVLVHGRRAPSHLPLPQYNWEFQKVLVEAKLDVDNSVTFLWKKEQGAGKAGPKAAPRTATVAAGRNPNTHQTVRNVFLQHSELLTGVFQDMPPYSAGDLLRVQNVESLRELDVLDVNNMSSEERRSLLGSQWWTQLINPRVDAAQNVFDGERAKAAGPVKAENTKRQKKEEDTAATPPRGSGATAALASASPRPLLVISVGISNGNLAMALADMCTRRGKCLHYLGLDYSATAVEFTERRVGEWAYKKWFLGELDLGEKPRPIRTPLSREALGNFNPAPLTLTDGEGRLHVPASLYEEFQNVDATRPDVENFLAEHYETFLRPDAKYSLSVIERALQGETSTPGGPNQEKLPEPPSDPNDPRDTSGLELMTGRRDAVSSCSKFRIHVSQAGRLHVSVQTDTVVQAGQRLAGFGSGGLRLQKEVSSLLTKGGLLVKPLLQKDSDYVIWVAPDNTEKYTTLYTALTQALASGALRWPVEIPFHTLTRAAAKSSNERETYEIAATHEKVWLAIPKQGREGELDTKGPNWSNVLRFMPTTEGLNNQLVRTVWVVRAHELGLLKLERPVLVWNQTVELKAGNVMRLA